MDARLIEHEFTVPGEMFDVDVQPSYDVIEEAVGHAVADLILADPPYNLGVQYADDPTGDKLSEEAYFSWCSYVMGSLHHMLKPGGTLWWICPEEHGDMIGPMLTTEIGPRVHRIIWHETFSQYNRYGLTKDYRFVFCHRKQGDDITFNPDPIRVPSKRMELGDKRAAGPRIPGCVWQLRRLQGTAIHRVDWHKAQLPPELLDRILLGWSNPGDLVLDAFAGSGSLGERCKVHDRRFIGIERSKTYIYKIAERLGLSREQLSLSTS